MSKEVSRRTFLKILGGDWPVWLPVGPCGNVMKSWPFSMPTKPQPMQDRIWAKSRRGITLRWGKTCPCWDLMYASADEIFCSGTGH